MTKSEDIQKLNKKLKTIINCLQKLGDKIDVIDHRTLHIEQKLESLEEKIEEIKKND